MENPSDISITQLFSPQASGEALARLLQTDSIGKVSPSIILDNTIIINLLFISITFKRRVIPNKWLGDGHPLPNFFRTFKHLLPLEPRHWHEVQEALNSKFWLATEQKVELPQRNDAQPQLRTSWPQNNSAFYASFLFAFSIVIFNATHYYNISNIM